MNLFKFGHSLVDKMRNLFKEDLPSHVISGMTAPTSGTLTHTITAGVASVDGYRVALSATGHTYTASRDTYVDLSNIGVLTFVEVANLAAEPAITADSVRFLKVVTDGTTITASDRFRGTGVLNSGVVVPLARMQRTEQSAVSVGIKTTTLDADVDIVSINMGTVTLGDRILVTALAKHTKGGIAGQTKFQITLSAGDTAFLQVYGNHSVLFGDKYQAANETATAIHVSGILRVSQTGTLNLKLILRSAGSAGSVASGDGQIHAIVLNNG